MAPPHLSLPLLAAFSVLSTGVSSLPSKKCGNHVRDELFSPLGCFTNNEGGVKALTGLHTASDDMTIEKCAAFCSQFEIFGVEYGRECSCGNIKAPSSTRVNAADCWFPCAGNPAQKCGAGNRLNLYTNTNPVDPGPATSLPGVTSLGCFIDGSPRLFPYNLISTNDMTAAKCAAHCVDYPYFGTQWSSECYCGTSAPIQEAPLSECSMPCSGNPDELCGATLRLNVYKFDDAASASSTASASPITTAPVSTPTIDGFEYKGCYTDNVPQNVLTGSASGNGTMTPALCAASCSAGGYKWFGLEYGVECYCGNELDAASVQVVNSECNMACGGDPSLKCGAGNRLSLYGTPDATVHVPGSNLATVGEFRYSSCWVDDNYIRVLSAVDYRTDDMTIEKCADRCEDYLSFGMEYGRECYCGNELNGGRIAPEQDCGMTCMGNGSQLCGGPARLNLYTRAAASSSSVLVSSSAAPSLSSSTASVSISSVVPSSAEPVSSSSSEPVSSSSDEPGVSSSASSVSSASFASSAVLILSSSSSKPIASSSAPSVALSSYAAPISSPSLDTPSSSAIPSSSSVPPTSSSIPPSSSESSTPSSTIPSTTPGPELTSITTCPSSSTLSGPEWCYLSGNHPTYCNTLTSSVFNSRGLSSMLTACRRSITTYGNTADPIASACFPTSVAAVPANSDVAYATARSVYSCLFPALLCTFASECQTKTYTVGVDTIPTPTPSIGVNLVQNPSFENDFTNWQVVGPTSANFPQQVATTGTTVRTGSKAWWGRYLNFNGATATTNQVIPNLEPGRPYQARLWYMHTNTAALATMNVQINPGAFAATVNLQAVPANTWQELVIGPFMVVTPAVQLIIAPNAQVMGQSGTPGGIDNMYVDDVSFVRLS